MIQLSPIPARDKSFDHNLLVHADGAEVFHAQFRGDYVFPMKPGGLAHGFVEQSGDDPAVEKARSPLIFNTELKPAHDALASIILFERKLHAPGICAATDKAGVLRFGIESQQLLKLVCPGRISARPLGELDLQDTLPDISIIGQKAYGGVSHVDIANLAGFIIWPKARQLQGAPVKGQTKVA